MSRNRKREAKCRDRCEQIRFIFGRMRSLLILALILFGCGPPDVRASDAKTLVKTLKATAQPGSGITQEEQEVAKKLQAVGPAAIPYLLPLLRDQNEDIRALASYTLIGMKGLTEQHLDALIESRRRGDGWIPGAIAEIGTPKAVTFLVEELVRERQTGTQVTWSIKKLGKKAVPELVQIYQAEEGWDDKLEETMFSVFKELGAHAAEAIDLLLKMAADEAQPERKRIRAIAAVGAIGIFAERAVPDLQKLRGHGAVEVRNAATSAILNIGSVDAAPILAQSLEQTPDPFGRELILRDIAELKERGNSAGPAVVRHLADDDWNVRVAAARALGYIGYKKSADDLIKLLNRVDDWRLALSAAESLGKLKTERAIPTLSGVSKDHWYRPVRQAALNAIEAIRDGVAAKPKDSSGHFPSEFFGYEHAGEKMDSLEREEAKLIRFSIAAPNPPAIFAIKGKDGAMKNVRLGGAVKIEDGYLVGADLVEWGGGITFVDLEGNLRVIASANTEAIYKTAHGIFAVTGLAHMTLNSGFIYRISKPADGAWAVEKWRALPGAPRFSRLLKDGNLFISCYGGIVLVSPDGDMKSLTRGESLRISRSPRKR